MAKSASIKPRINTLSIVTAAVQSTVTPVRETYGETYDSAVKSTKANKSEFSWRKAIDKVQADLEAVCTARQIEIIERIGVRSFEYADVQEGFRVQFAADMAELHPDGKVGYATYNPIVRSIRTNWGPHAATCYRDAVAAMPNMGGKIPTAKDKRAKGGTKGLTAAKWYQGVSRRQSDLVQHIGKAPRGNVNVDALRRYVAALKELVAADKALAKAINE